MQKNSKPTIKQQKNVLLTFLKQTKDGKYAKIEKSSLPYSRLQEQREETYYEEYYYSMT